MSKKYVIRTVVTGIICYFLLAFIFPNMSIFVEMLIVAVFFFTLQWFFPSVRRFFSGPDSH